MNRNLIVTLLALVAAGALFFGYRAYKLSADRDLEQQRAAAELVLAREHQAELARRAAAAIEARRMAEARAKEEMERQNRLREEQTALAAAEAEAARLASEADQLLAEKNAAEAEAARLAALRGQESAGAEAARLAALQKLRDLDHEKRLQADRAAARLAALRRQQAWEAEAERLALEQQRNAWVVGGYLVRDIKSLYIMRPEHPATPPVPDPAKPPSN
jgi:hypothetical protein